MSDAPWIQADWPAPPGVRAITTKRLGAGVSQAPFDTFNLGLRSGDDADAVTENRRQLAEALALPAAPHWLQQVHGVGVVRVDAASSATDEPQADAAVTGVPGAVLASLTADCLPVVFAAKDGREIAAAHAGWPGLSKGMLEATLAAMEAPAADVVAWIGPAAGPQRYEVGGNVYAAFVS